MINVLALVTFKVFPPQMGGQKGVALFYQHVKGFVNVLLAVSHNNEPIPNNNLRIEPILFDNRKMFLNPFVLLRLKKIIQQNGIQLIVAEHSYSAWMAWAVSKMFQIPFVIHSHNIEALRFQQMRRRWWKLYWHYEKWIHQKAYHSFFISREDAQYAVENFQLHSQKSSVVTYGVEVPYAANLTKDQWRTTLGLHADAKLLYFNGTLSYKPNFDAVQVLLHTLVPLLQKELSDFKILISGNQAPQTLIDQMQQHPHFHYLGFVEEVALVYQMADVFVNPVLNNSGVKTKVVEALAAHCTVVSTTSGAAGVEKDVCGGKLLLSEDNDWSAFASLLVQQANQPRTNTPKAFFDTYLWNNIAQKAAQKMVEVVREHAR